MALVEDTLARVAFWYRRVVAIFIVRTTARNEIVGIVITVALLILLIVGKRTQF